jgi:hypothetical protein
MALTPSRTPGVGRVYLGRNAYRREFVLDALCGEHGRAQGTGDYLVLANYKHRGRITVRLEWTDVPPPRQVIRRKYATDEQI